MKRNRNVKIVATLGPASSDYETIRALFETGVDVFRLNMSHGTHEEQGERHAIIRQIEKDLNSPIAILADLQGPKLRVGVFANDAENLEEGASFRLDLDETPGDLNRVQLPHPEIFAALEAGASLLVNDGKIRLKVEDCGADYANCVVVAGGTISNRKGVNVPDVVLPLAALTEKDRKDLEFACTIGVDWLALSFVQRPEDMIEARTLVQGRAKVLAKIEKPSAIEAFDAVLEVSDGIMVARGDLGVELPAQRVPPLQKQMIRKCRKAAKPVIVATQMLESMIESPMPTRAEVTDVATAIYEGADAVMLSAESAAGKYPIEAVGMMDSIAQEIEADENYRQIIDSSRQTDGHSVSDGIVAAARQLAETTTDIKVICCYTYTGTTARFVARERSVVPTLAMTPNEDAARVLCLTWGTRAVVTPKMGRFKQAVLNAVAQARDTGYATKEDQILLTAGVPFNVPGSTNILRVAPCDEALISVSDPE